MDPGGATFERSRGRRRPAASRSSALQPGRFMSGPLGVMSVVLLESAVGAAVVLWASGVWGVVKRGFFLLTGSTVALCALAAFQLLRTQAGDGAVPAAGVWVLGALTALAW